MDKSIFFAETQSPFPKFQDHPSITTKYLRKLPIRLTTINFTRHKKIQLFNLSFKEKTICTAVKTTLSDINLCIRKTTIRSKNLKVQHPLLRNNQANRKKETHTIQTMRLIFCRLHTILIFKGTTILCLLKVPREVSVN